MAGVRRGRLEDVVALSPFVSDIADGAVVVDVRWYLDGRSGHDAFLAGHIPGAQWVDLDREPVLNDIGNWILDRSRSGG